MMQPLKLHEESPHECFFFFYLWVENKPTLKCVHGIHVYMYSELTNAAALGREKRKMTNILFGCLVTWSLERCKIEATCKMNLFKYLGRHAWFWNHSTNFVGSCVHTGSSVLDALVAVIEFHPLWGTVPATDTTLQLIFQTWFAFVIPMALYVCSPRSNGQIISSNGTWPIIQVCPTWDFLTARSGSPTFCSITGGLGEVTRFCFKCRSVIDIGPHGNTACYQGSGNWFW